MPRPTPKADLIQAANDQFAKLWTLIGEMSDEELFSKGVFDWTGTTTLGSYCVSATSSHYNWAFKDIKKALKKYRAR